MTKARKCPTCGRKTTAKRESGCCSICEKKSLPRYCKRSADDVRSETSRALSMVKLINRVLK